MSDLIVNNRSSAENDSGLEFCYAKYECPIPFHFIRSCCSIYRFAFFWVDLILWIKNMTWKVQFNLHWIFPINRMFYFMVGMTNKFGFSFWFNGIWPLANNTSTCFYFIFIIGNFEYFIEHSPIAFCIAWKHFLMKKIVHLLASLRSGHTNAYFVFVFFIFFNISLFTEMTTNQSL